MIAPPFKCASADASLTAFFSKGKPYRRSHYPGTEYVVPEPIPGLRTAPGSAARNPSSTEDRCGCDSLLQSRSERNTPDPICTSGRSGGSHPSREEGRREKYELRLPT